MKVDKEKEVLRDQLASHTHSPIAHPTLLPLQVLRDQLADVQKRVGKGEAEEARFKAEVITLNMIINEADAERLKQQKEYETVLSERDVLGTQLIKRNDELGGLYEKIKVQQSTLNATRHVTPHTSRPAPPAPPSTGAAVHIERGAARVRRARRGHPGAPRRHRRPPLRARRPQGERPEHRPAPPRGAPAQPRGAPRAHEGARLVGGARPVT